MRRCYGLALLAAFGLLLANAFLGCEAFPGGRRMGSSPCARPHRIAGSGFPGGPR